MIRKTAIAIGVGAVVLVGAAGTAFAAENDRTPTPAPTSSPAPAPAHRHAHRLFRGEYGTWTTFDTTTHTATVHDAIRGTVSAVSSTDITVKSTDITVKVIDGTSQTYAVGDGTTVHLKGATKQATPSAATIGQVKVGDRAVVLGTGSGNMTATRVLDRGAAPAPAS